MREYVEVVSMQYAWGGNHGVPLEDEVDKFMMTLKMK